MRHSSRKQSVTLAHLDHATARRIMPAAIALMEERIEAQLGGEYTWTTADFYDSSETTGGDPLVGQAIELHSGLWGGAAIGLGWRTSASHCMTIDVRPACKVESALATGYTVTTAIGLAAIAALWCKFGIGTRNIIAITAAVVAGLLGFLLGIGLYTLTAAPVIAVFRGPQEIPNERLMDTLMRMAEQAIQDAARSESE